MKKQKTSIKNNKGITLIALIITIIVLLILAVVSINVVVNSGIIKHAENAVNKYKEEEAKEKLALALMEQSMGGVAVTDDVKDRINRIYQGAYDFTGDSEYAMKVATAYLNPDPGASTFTEYGIAQFKVTYGENTKMLMVLNYVPEGVNPDEELYLMDSNYVMYKLKQENGNISLIGKDETIENVTLGDASIVEKENDKYKYYESLDGYFIWEYMYLGNEEVVNVGEDFKNQCVRKIDNMCKLEFDADGKGTILEDTTLKEVILPDSVVSISEMAFFKRKGLEKIKMPKSLQYIGSHTFAYTGITSIDLPESLETIRQEAFYNCELLTQIDIPSSIATIETGAFSGCNNLKTINIRKAENSIAGAPWGATNATVNWLGE